MLQIQDGHLAAAANAQEWQALDNETAFKTIYAMFWKNLFAMAYSRLNDKQEAEDIVHDVFVSLWVNRNKVSIRMLDHYLFTAVKNQVLTRIKKKAHERAYAKSLNDQVSSTALIETSLHHKGILTRVQDEIEDLPEKCRLIFKYSRDEGMPVKQIAKRLSISPKTVENQLNKALKQIRLSVRIFMHTF